MSNEDNKHPEAKLGKDPKNNGTMKETTLSNKEEIKSAVPPVPPEGWDRCHAYLEQKRRFCRQRPNDASSIYCGNHQHLVATDTGRKRIPCPIDPSHLIFEDMVDKHVLICPRSKRRKRQMEHIFYKENINAGGHGGLDTSSPTGPVSDSSFEWAKKLALRVLQVHQQIFCSSQDESNLAKISVSQIHNALPLQDLSSRELDLGMVEGIQAYKIKSGGSRHIPQIASMVGHLRALDVLPSVDSPSIVLPTEPKPLLLLEMGAGRGVFGLAVAGVAAANEIPTRLTMVERTGSRSKADKILRAQHPSSKDDATGSSGSYMKLDSVQWSRIECDLAHMDLAVALNNDEFGKDGEAKVVVIAKHLCGAATDLALKAMEPIRERVNACLLATCCHGRCDWKDYVGRDYLHEAMSCKDIHFGSKEFDLLRQWCAGAVACQTITTSEKADGANDNVVAESQVEQEEEPEHTTEKQDDVAPDAANRVNISAVVNGLQLECGIEGLGRACQRLIDFGRREYLRNSIFNSNASITNLVHYVPPSVSPQNACLVGRVLPERRGEY